MEMSWGGESTMPRQTRKTLPNTNGYKEGAKLLQDKVLQA